MAADVREHAAVLALTEISSVPWHRISDLLEEAGSALALLHGELDAVEPAQTLLARQLAERAEPGMLDRWQARIERTLAEQPGTWLMSVLDEDYPANLRAIYNRPPFLFVRGTLTDQDTRSVAVVGTRDPSPEGRRLAAEMAAALAQRGASPSCPAWPQASTPRRTPPRSRGEAARSP